MGRRRASYEDVRDQIQPGDLIAFGGKGNLSQIIKAITRGPVSHVGVILRTQRVGDGTDRFFQQLVESTTLDGFSGVTTNRVSDRLRLYPGDAWWLPRRRTLPFDEGQFFNFLFTHVTCKTPYDSYGAFLAGLDVMEGRGWTRAEEDFGRLFCSELVAAGLEAAGTIGPVNASEVTPMELVRWAIYEPYYVQLQGLDLDIPDFNSREAP